MTRERFLSGLCVTSLFVALGARPAAASPAVSGSYPTVIVAVADDESWVVVCQARQDTDADGRVAVAFDDHGKNWGDRLRTYLVLRDGTEKPLDEFIGHSSSNRYVAYIDQRRLFVHDTVSGTRVDLSARGADLGDPDPRSRRHRAARFSWTKELMVYLRTREGVMRVVVRDLRTGAEHEVRAPQGPLWSVDFGPLSRWLVAYSALRDTDGNGRLELRISHTNKAPRRCRWRVRSHTSFRRTGDKLWRSLAPVSGKSFTEAPGFAGFLGAGVVRRLENGTYTWIQGDTEKILWRAKNKSHLVGGLHSMDRLLYATPETESESALWLVSLDGRKRLGRVPTVGIGKRRGYSRVPWMRATPTTYVNLLDGRLRNVPGKHVVLWGDNVLKSEDGMARVTNLESGFVTTLGPAPKGGAVRSGDFVAWGGLLVRLVDVPEVRRYQGEAFAVSVHGRVLVPARMHQGVPIAPLHWR